MSNVPEELQLLWASRDRVTEAEPLSTGIQDSSPKIVSVPYSPDVDDDAVLLDSLDRDEFDSFVVSPALAPTPSAPIPFTAPVTPVSKVKLLPTYKLLDTPVNLATYTCKIKTI